MSKKPVDDSENVHAKSTTEIGNVNKVNMTLTDLRPVSQTLKDYSKTGILPVPKMKTNKKK